METTRRLLEDSRGQAVRLQDIAQAADVSRQAIYLHFGSRARLMVATVRYIDESAGFAERTKHVRDEADSLVALGLFVDFWAEYVPTICRLAKQLMLLRETDNDAAAAWEDRMEGLRNGPCRFLVHSLEEDGRLAAGWQREMAVDFLWSLLSIQTWEKLVVERGWSGEQYATTLKEVLKRALVRDGAS